MTKVSTARPLPELRNAGVPGAGVNGANSQKKNSPHSGVVGGGSIAAFSLTRGGMWETVTVSSCPGVTKPSEATFPLAKTTLSLPGPSGWTVAAPAAVRPEQAATARHATPNTTDVPLPESTAGLSHADRVVGKGCDCDRSHPPFPKLREIQKLGPPQIAGSAGGLAGRVVGGFNSPGCVGGEPSGACGRNNRSSRGRRSTRKRGRRGSRLPRVAPPCRKRTD